MNAELKSHRWTDRQQVTLQDVAHAAGVSSSAASVILNGARSGTRVSSHTRRIVLETAERLGYRPNALARSLLTGRSNRICVYGSKSRLNARSAFYAEVLGGICDGTSEFGLNTMIHTAGYDEEGLLGLLTNRAVDGLILHTYPNDPLLPLLGELRVPAVAIADDTSMLPSVVVDDAAGGILQAQHLASLGHKHVITKRYPFTLSSSSKRMDAFTEAAGRLGVKVTTRFETYFENDGLDSDDVRVLTEGHDRATAVVTWSDHVAQGVCSKLDSLGIKIPGEVAVVGFDGFSSHAIPKYPLTTIRAPWSAVGKTATKILVALIGGETVPLQTVLPVEFVRGATT